MKPVSYLYPNGGKHAVTFSYDDGRDHDRRLVDIFNCYGFKGTFHLNSGSLDKPGYVREGEVSALYTGHEIAAHTVSHPFMSSQPPEAVLSELLEDRRKLEQLAGYPVRGFSYPFGDAGGEAVPLAKAAGVDYARTVVSTNGFHFPDNFLLWHPTCHDKGAMETLPRFLRQSSWNVLRLLYIWGHSYEFEDGGGWAAFEELCGKLKDIPGCWFATNVEVMTYIKAVRAVRWSVDGTMADNPSSVGVFIKNGDAVVELSPGLNML
jgi:hypothetical protein